jgi:hypothetical protein
MLWRFRIALFTSAVMAAALCTVRADDKAADDKKDTPAEKKDDKKEPIAPPKDGAAPAGEPCYRTILVTECVPEYYKTTRTVYKQECVPERYTAYRTECVPEKYTAYRTECVPEKYTAYRTECVPETRTRNVTHYERVCETRQVTKTVCERICVQEERTCFKAVWTCVPVTTMVCKTVDRGHWECREVPCSEGFLSRLRHHKNNDCGCGCDPCNTCCAPPTKTEKVWVSCKVTEQVPCTKMERKCEMVPHKEMVSVWKSIPKTVTCNETFWKCVPVCKTETYTCNVSRCVPYEATRMVSHCVPYEATRNVSRCVPYEATRNVTRCVPVTEEVTACRMVARQVEKRVPVCETPCNACNTCCETSCCKPSLRDRLGSLRGRFGHKGGCGCESGCSSCGGGCGCGH